ncbi:MAG: peptidyl-prolyl cis-trans isomerase [Melioribacteraceae bacterium]|nr:peptidyl-prolyl cis-trans isomerase [Melioribacteraceae bacterium]
MKYLREHLKRTSLTKLVFLAVILLSCSEEENVPENYLAKVENSYLKKSDLKDMNIDFQNVKQRDAFINNWVKNEVLFQESIKQNNDENIDEVLQSIRKELIINYLIESKVKNSSRDFTEEELKEHYELFRQNFVLSNELYFLNGIELSDEKTAHSFIDQFNSSAVKTFPSEFKNAISIFTNKKYYDFSCPSKDFYNSIRYLDENELSKVIKSEQNSYLVVQLVRKYEPGTIPDYEIVKEKVKESLTVKYKQKIIDDFVRELLEDYEIEIKG